MDGRSVWTECVMTVSGQDTMRDAARLMHKKNIGCLIVVDDGKPVGIITERDFVGYIAADVEPDKTKVADIMTKNPIMLKASEDISKAREIMLAHEIRHIPVVDDQGRLAGILSLRDLIKAHDTRPKTTTIKFCMK